MASFQLASDLLTAIFNGIKTKIFNYVYPVGSIYISTSSTSPATLFGGTWTEIKGRFLVGHDSSSSMPHKTLGANIGSWTTEGHTLTVNEIPSHRHDFENSGRPLYWDSNLGAMGGLTSGDNVQYTWAARTGYTGGGAAHSHDFCPPALVVKIWKRTA